MTQMPIDQSILDNFRVDLGDNDGALLAELINDYLVSSPELIAKMQQSLSQDNLAALAVAAHTLKSSSAYLGAIQLGKLCTDLDDLGKAGQASAAREKYVQVRAEYERVEQALVHLLSELG